MTRLGRAGLVLLGLASALFGLADGVRGQDPQAQTLLGKMIAAHGGMQAWESLKDMAFTLTVVRLTPHGDVASAQVSLHYLKRHGKGRVETVTGRGFLVQGFDGQRPWVTLGGRADTSEDALKRAHFQAVNWWYWMGIPFKLRDPGVILRHRGAASVRGKPVEVLEATFGSDGEPTDRFTYYVDPETAHIVFVEVQLKPGVWPGVGGPNVGRSVWLDYKPVGPFTMHTRRISYGDPELTDRRAIVLFGDFQFNTGLPDRLFRAP